jgi:hypothetical protein
MKRGSRCPLDVKLGEDDKIFFSLSGNGLQFLVLPGCSWALRIVLYKVKDYFVAVFIAKMIVTFTK